MGTWGHWVRLSPKTQRGETVKGTFDIHTHILPQVDDGAQNPEQAMVLLRQAFEDGTRGVFLTPHYRGRYRKHTGEFLNEAFASFREQVRQELPELELYLGQEVYFESEAGEKLRSGQVLTMAGSAYVLLEFPPSVPRSRVLEGIDHLTEWGYTPIIAHAERYRVFRDQKELAREAVQMGALIQLNADSILGAQGWGIRLYCRRLLKQGLAHFVASDAHDPESRPPLLDKCRRHIEKHHGTEYAEALFSENPRAVIENRMI